MKRGVLALILVCLLTLLPFKVAMADGSSMRAAVTVLLGFTAKASLPITYPVSNEAEGWDSLGRAVSLSGGILSIQISKGKAAITLPLTLSDGQSLASFTDPVSGVAFSESKLIIPLKDLNGNEVMSILAEIEAINGNGSSTEIVAKKVVLKSAEFSVDLSPADKKVSNVSASFEIDLKSLPPDAFIKTSIHKDPDKDIQDVFQLAAVNDGSLIMDTAYILTIDKINLENKTNLGEATITMKVGQAWAERYGVDKISILCCNEEGDCQVLPTTFKGYEDEQAIFQATSPDGLSIFGLVALVPLMPGSVNWAFMIGVMGSGSVMAVGSLSFFIIRRRRAKEAALSERWPTGLKPEDWEAK